MAKNTQQVKAEFLSLSSALGEGEKVDDLVHAGNSFRFKAKTSSINDASFHKAHKVLTQGPNIAIPQPPSFLTSARFRPYNDQSGLAA